MLHSFAGSINKLLNSLHFLRDINIIKKQKNCDTLIWVFVVDDDQ